VPDFHAIPWDVRLIAGLLAVSLTVTVILLVRSGPDEAPALETAFSAPDRMYPVDLSLRNHHEMPCANGDTLILRERKRTPIHEPTLTVYRRSPDTDHMEPLAGTGGQDRLPWVDPRFRPYLEGETECAHGHLGSVGAFLLLLEDFIVMQEQARRALNSENP